MADVEQMVEPATDVEYSLAPLQAGRRQPSCCKAFPSRLAADPARMCGLTTSMSAGDTARSLQAVAAS